MSDPLTHKEQQLLVALRRNPKGSDQNTLLTALPTWSENDIALALNSLSAKQHVDFLQGPGQTLLFRARDDEEISKTGSMSDNERIVYQFIKASGNKGTWIKDIKVKSGLHAQIVTQMIKNLEKKVLIKAVKSVKTPTKKVYMLSELDPSVELTGGAWYTDQELDVEFIDQLAHQIYKYICSKSFPPNTNSIFPSSHPYPTCNDLHKWISKSGITTVQLSHTDVQSLIDRLIFDGKVEQIQSIHTGSSMGRLEMFSNPTDRLDSGDEDEWNGGDEDIWAYRATRSSVLNGSVWTDVPCGRCPVFSFCEEGGPVSPSGCVYFKKWLSF
ncbi:hypothetical protein BDV3_004261 [Batrachochytrium dendrobatidis]|uniref:DNA-directed RNA polymerase III subunit RPC6 n=1 Tax=Batrachochytrium dendrobatidis (strain JEL423) TaxID=403673 RepID=A0A177WFE9_BATDL|nr:34-kDa subunit of RNA polymerase III (C) [Batrachochytrium dendrobatidis]KAK5673026.1 34-kDa subunit of RNA polymerase III (C) [Batrachochytrium dendrobatidis]OAJ38838.1 hypothetical protein BDEG_22736 [Batrachochytrium dendrobatidis JEL423]